MGAPTGDDCRPASGTGAMDRLGSEALSSIIGDIYDCALAPDAWSAVLVRITEAVDAAYTTIALAGPRDGRARFAARSPWDEARMDALQDYGFEEIPGLAEAIGGDIDAPAATLSLMSEAELGRTPFFRDWAGPQGLREACMTKFVHTSDRIGLVSHTTFAGRGVITPAELRFVALLAPHLRRAAMIGDLLDQQRVTTATYRSSLDNLGTAVILASAAGAVLYANARAEMMLSSGSAITLRNGVLHARNPLTSSALLDAIATASEADMALGARGIGLPISAAGQPPAVAYVLPLSDGTARASLRPACAAVFISTTTSTSLPPDAVLASLFGLTPAESRVLLRIGSGLTLARSAQLLDVSENTLKTHLARIYAKTGTRRQADLVRLVADIGAPTASAGEPRVGGVG